MNFTAEINIMPLKEILDPQGKAVMQGLTKIGFPQVQNVRVGKHITLELEAADKDEAQKIAEDCCRKLLANLIVEEYLINII